MPQVIPVAIPDVERIVIVLLEIGTRSFEGWLDDYKRADWAQMAGAGATTMTRKRR
jgi:hypothetical protein